MIQMKWESRTSIWTIIEKNSECIRCTNFSFYKRRKIALRNKMNVFIRSHKEPLSINITLSFDLQMNSGQDQTKSNY